MKAYINIGTIDARFASQDVLKDIVAFTNVGSIFYTPDQHQAMNHIQLTNVGTSLQLSQSAAIISHNGDLTLTQAYMVELPHEVVINVNGTLIIDPIDNLDLLTKLNAPTLTAMYMPHQKLWPN